MPTYNFTIPYLWGFLVFYVRSRDKIIVVACPTQNRIPFAAMYLKQKGYDAKYLEEGFLNLVAKLKGGEAKKIKEK